MDCTSHVFDVLPLFFRLICAFLSISSPRATGGLADEVKEANLAAVFQPFGEVLTVQIPIDPQTSTFGVVGLCFICGRSLMCQLRTFGCI